MADAPARENDVAPAGGDVPPGGGGPPGASPPGGPGPFPSGRQWRDGARAALRMAVDFGTIAWRWVALRYLFTTFALLLSLVVVFLLPQTQHVIWQLPALGGLGGAELALSLLFYGFVAALLAAYALMALALEPRVAGGRGWSPSGLVGDGWSLVAPHVDPPSTRRDRLAGFAEWPGRRLLGLRGATRRRIGWGLLIAWAILGVLTRLWAQDLPPGVRTFGLFGGAALGLLGGWMASVPAGLGRTPGAPHDPEAAVRALGYKHNLVGRALWLLLISYLIGEGLWLVASRYPQLVSFRVYTIWAVIQLVFVITTLARVVDACHAYSRWNIRALAALGLMVGLTSMPSQQVGRFWKLPPRPRTQAGAETGAGTEAVASGPRASLPAAPLPAAQAPAAAPMTALLRGLPAPRVDGPWAGSPVLPMDETIQEMWFRAMEARLAAIPPGPMLIVTASGGGARAALFTSLVLEALRAEAEPEDLGPLPPRCGPTGPLPAPPPGPREGGRRPTLADRILLISGVSGGSLASAYYLHQRYEHVRSYKGRDLGSGAPQVERVDLQPSERDAWRSAYRGDISHRMRELALAMLDDARIGRRQAGARSPQTTPEFLENLEVVAQECDRLARGTLASSTIAPWLTTSAFVDDMATDFTAPLLRGVLLPGVERGESVTEFWEERFGWANVEDLDLHRRLAPREAQRPRSVPTTLTNGAPLALFNACDVSRGSRLILGFPPVPPGMITDPLVSTTASGPYSLTDRGDVYYHVRLAEAVRLSANFPWGFETAHLALKRGDEPIHVVDGGIVDNSGIDSVSYLIQGLARMSEKYRRRSVDGPCGPGDYECRADRILEAFRSRGVILVQIDSGTKDLQVGGPSIFSLLDSLAPVVFRPIQALNNTSYTNADLAILGYDHLLEQELTPRPPALPALPVPPFTPQPMSEEAPPAPPVPVDLPPVPQGPEPPMAPESTSPGPRDTLGRIERELDLVDRPLPSAEAPAKAMPAPAMPAPAAPPPFGPRPPMIRRIRLTCNNAQNVMTAWTLGPDDKALVLVQFLNEWNLQRELIARAYRRVAQTSGAYQIGNAGALDCLYQDFLDFKTGQTLEDRGRDEFYRSFHAGRLGVDPGFGADQSVPPPQPILQALPAPSPYGVPAPQASQSQNDPALDRYGSYRSQYRDVPSAQYPQYAPPPQKVSPPMTPQSDEPTPSAPSPP